MREADELDTGCWMLDAGWMSASPESCSHHLAAQTPEIVVVTPGAVKFHRGARGNRPILTFSDSPDHFIAIVATELSQKLSASPKKDQTLPGRTSDLGRYDPGPSMLW
jgi:hypothetical protein